MSTTGPSLSRRPALGLAGAVALAVAAVLAALAANLGLLSAAPSAAGKVGQLDGKNVAALVSSSPADSGSVSGSGSVTSTKPDGPEAVDGAKGSDEDHDPAPVTGTDDLTGGDSDD